MNDTKPNFWLKKHRDPARVAALHTECAAAGIDMPRIFSNDSGGGRADLFASRAECRRTLRALSEKAESAVANTPEFSRLWAVVDTLGSAITDLSVDLDLAESHRAERAESTTQWRDAQGRPLAVVGVEHAGRMAEVLGRTERPEFGFGDFVRGVAGLRTSEAVRAALSVGTDAAGGYAVPSILLPQFIEALTPASSVLQAGARVMPISDPGKTFRIARVGTIPTAAWRSEAGAVAESDPALTALDLTPQSLAFHFKVSRELLADSPNVDAMLISAIAQAFAKELDRAALRGSGTPPEVRGLLNISGIGSVANGANGAALGTITWSNLIAAVQTVLDANGPLPTAAIMAPRTLAGYASLADSTGQPLQKPELLRDVRFIATSQLPVNLTVGTSSDCSETFVGDFREFILAMRENVTVARANELHIGTGQIGFYCFVRADVGCVHPASFVKITGIRP